MTRDRCGLRILDREECLSLLHGGQLAATSVTVNALPVVLPVAVARVDEALYLRADPDGVLARRMPGCVVALLIGAMTADRIGGWSVSVTGLAERVTEPHVLDSPLASCLPAWTDHDVLVRVPITVVSGREFIATPIEFGTFDSSPRGTSIR